MLLWYVYIVQVKLELLIRAPNGAPLVRGGVGSAGSAQASTQALKK